MIATSPLKFLRFWFPLILYSGIIFGVSSLPNTSVPLSGLHFDKIIHVIEFAPFGALFAFGLNNSKKQVSARMLLGLSALAAFLYGLSDEYHQSFVIGRSAGIDDAIADAIGGMLGGYIYWMRIQSVRGR